jgi:hypothetical protein
LVKDKIIRCGNNFCAAGLERARLSDPRVDDAGDHLGGIPKTFVASGANIADAA